MNIENLLKMADYLETLEPSQFDMGLFSDGDIQSNNVEHICGSVGCVIGHAPKIFPLAPEDWDTLGDFDFDAFSKRIFTDDMQEWDWCFDSDWDEVDNTPKGASLRMRHLVEHGLPEDWKEQLYRDTDYLFADELEE